MVVFGECFLLTCDLFFIDDVIYIYINGIDPVGACFFEGTTCGEPHVPIAISILEDLRSVPVHEALG